MEWKMKQNITKDLFQNQIKIKNQYVSDAEIKIRHFRLENMMQIEIVNDQIE